MLCKNWSIQTHLTRKNLCATAVPHSKHDLHRAHLQIRDPSSPNLDHELGICLMDLICLPTPISLHPSIIIHHPPSIVHHTYVLACVVCVFVWGPGTLPHLVTLEKIATIFVFSVLRTVCDHRACIPLFLGRKNQDGRWLWFFWVQITVK